MRTLTRSIGLAAALIFALMVPSTFAGSPKETDYSPGMKAKMRATAL